MKTKTYRERLIAGLKSMGYIAEQNRSKYDAFVHTQRSNKLFVGSNGALRSGPSASNSYSLGDPANQSTLYKQILEKGDAELNKAVTDH